MSYYQLNRTRLLQKTDIITVVEKRGKARNQYRNLSQEEKEVKRALDETDIEILKKIKNNFFV